MTLGSALALGCGSPTLGDEPGSTDGVEPSDGSTSSDEASADETTTDGGVDESSGAPEAPRCGDGVVDPGEECDGPTLPCSADCRLRCDLGPGIELQTSDTVRIYFDHPPIAVADGTGDYVIPTDRGGSRVNANGEQLWANTSWRGEWTMTLVQHDPGEFWRVSQDDETSFVTRHEMGNGDELFGFELTPGPDGPSYAMKLEFAPDGDLLVLYVIDSEPVTRTVALQRRSPDGATVEWSTIIPTAPDPRTGYSFDGGGTIDVSADGVIWVTGSDYLDYDTTEPFVASLDSDGGLRWKRNLMEGDIHANGFVASVALLEGGHAVLAPGRGYRSGPTLGILFDQDSGLMRVDDQGETVWTADPSTWVNEGRLHVRDLWILSDDRLAFAGHQRFDDHIIAATGILDATDGSLLCSSTTTHPWLEITLAERIFAGTDGSLMAVLTADDVLQTNTVVAGRWIARFGE